MCKAIAYKPFAEVGAVHRTRRRSPVLVQRYRDAAYRSARNGRVEIVRSLRPAAILQAVLAPAKLAAFQRINSPETNARAVNLQRIAVDDTGVAGQIVGSGGVGSVK